MPARVATDRVTRPTLTVGLSAVALAGRDGAWVVAVVQSSLVRAPLTQRARWLIGLRQPGGGSLF